jgi:hypothetical protein
MARQVQQTTTTNGKQRDLPTLAAHARVLSPDIVSRVRFMLDELHADHCARYASEARAFVQAVARRGLLPPADRLYLQSLVESGDSVLYACAPFPDLESEQWEPTHDDGKEEKQARAPSPSSKTAHSHTDETIDTVLRLGRRWRTQREYAYLLFPFDFLNDECPPIPRGVTHTHPVMSAQQHEFERQRKEENDAALDEADDAGQSANTALDTRLALHQRY